MNKMMKKTKPAKQGKKSQEQTNSYSISIGQFFKPKLKTMFKEKDSDSNVVLGYN